MRKLTHILKFLTDKCINITAISFDELTQSTLIMLEKGMIEIDENNFIFYKEKLVQRHYNIPTEDIIKILENEL